MTANGNTIPFPSELTTPPAWTSQTVRGRRGSSPRRDVARERIERSKVSAVELQARIATVRMAETFVISRGSADEARVVVVELRHEGVSGFGEAAPIERYDESPESALAFVESVAGDLGEDPFALDDVMKRLPDDEFAARAAIDAALHDLGGKL